MNRHRRQDRQIIIGKIEKEKHFFGTEAEEEEILVFLK